MHEAAAGVCSADTFSPRLGMKAAQLASSNPPWRYLGRADILQNNLEVTGYNPGGFCLTCISCLLVHTRLFPPPAYFPLQVQTFHLHHSFTSLM